MPEIASIAYSPRDVPADPADYYQRVPISQTELVASHGIRGDRKGSNPDRGLNVMSAEILEGLAGEGFKTGPGQMGEQIVIRGIDVADLETGTRLQLGQTACIEVISLRTGCDRFEHIQGHAPETAARRLGVMAGVVTGGPIAVGDPVQVLEPALGD
jgi:MOSC domain-containing protein YiiM